MAKKRSSSNRFPRIDLRALEDEVLSEGREWMQRRMEEKLREKREAFSPGGGKKPPEYPAPEADDFYHASEHLWALARDLFADEESAHEWVGSLLKGLKRRGGTERLPILEELLEMAEDEWPEEERQVLRRETAYFQKHSLRLDYPKAKRHGFPLGSGAMESACSQLQGRFKRPGQFWTRPGERNLLALERAWRNGDWDQIWRKGA